MAQDLQSEQEKLEKIGIGLRDSLLELEKNHEDIYTGPPYAVGPIGEDLSEYAGVVTGLVIVYDVKRKSDSERVLTIGISTLAKRPTKIIIGMYGMGSEFQSISLEYAKVLEDITDVGILAISRPSDLFLS